MKKTLFSIAIGILIIISVSAFKTISSNGIAGVVGSSGEGTCASCHGGGTSTSSGVTITAIPSFSNNEYVPGSTYTMNIIVGAASFSHFGFACEILNTSNTNSGTMQSAGTGVKFLTAFNSRKTATHTTPKAGTGSATFSFQWVAPSSGNVNIYAAGNCVNFDGNTTGDLPLTTNLSLTAATPTNVGIQEFTEPVSDLRLFPNPVQNELSINYFLRESGKVSVELISVSGQKVAELMNMQEDSGLKSHQFMINESVATGIYFVKISLDNKQVSQRLISIR